jgi:PAS domain S-box-containing protein
MARRSSGASIWRPLALILFPSLLFVTVQIYSALRIVPDATATNARLSHTFEVMVGARALDEALEDAEVHQREFLITGDAKYLAGYRVARQEISKRLARLLQLTSGNAEQQRSLALLEQQTTTILTYLERAIAARQQDGLDAARAVLATDGGSEARHMARDLILSLLGAERGRLLQEQTVGAEARHDSMLAAAATSALAVSIMLIGSVLLVVTLVRAARAQQKLRQSEERFGLLVDNVRDYAILMLDPAGNISSWNRGAQRITGYAPEEIIGQHFSCFFPPDEIRDGVPASELARVLTEGRIEVEGWRLRRDGSRYWANIVTTAVHDEDGNLRGFAKVARDLTERRQQQQALEQSQAALAQSQKMEALGQLTGGVAHDFNNVLSTVLGNAELLRLRMKKTAPIDIDRFLDSLAHAVDHGKALTSRLLAFSRRQTLQPVSVDANQLVGGMADMLCRTLGEAIAVEVVAAAGLWRVDVDRNQLESAMLNLAINARDAMVEGGKLTIETGNTYLDDDYSQAHTDLKPGQYIMIAVSDTGTGMSKETMARAFDPFFTTKSEGKGTGLGLSQVYGFLKQSGGHVSLYSEPGQGTTVKMYLPRSFNAREPAAAIIRSDPQTQEGAGATLLVVEDDPEVRRFSTAALDLLGYRVLEADDGAQALRILKERPDVDLLFTDIGLPGLNGRQLADRARQVIPHLRVLFTTGYARNAILHNGVLDRGVNLLPKPFTIERLGQKIGETLRAG